MRLKFFSLMVDVYCGLSLIDGRLLRQRANTLSVNSPSFASGTHT